jgi:hypothetical protein
MMPALLFNLKLMIFDFLEMDTKSDRRRPNACPIVRTTMKTAADDIFSLQIFSDVLRTILKNFCSLLPVCNVSAPELLACSVLYTKAIERSKTGMVISS